MPRFDIDTWKNWRRDYRFGEEHSWRTRTFRPWVILWRPKHRVYNENGHSLIVRADLGDGEMSRRFLASFRWQDRLADWQWINEILEEEGYDLSIKFW